ncbi:hypothetical protein Bca52824_022596 [Brassica carinata]|uniref:Uncharacterized protein n=1 Tax=Brassica carinata TaxID=52824 RepID=A0A8X7VGM8_BRACI|nr:hypothetical protein Bca52824_022596 [Brassica carinata]
MYVYVAVLEKLNDAFPMLASDQFIKLSGKAVGVSIGCSAAPAQAEVPAADDDGDMDLLMTRPTRKRKLQRGGRLLKRIPKSPKKENLK